MDMDLHQSFIPFLNLTLIYFQKYENIWKCFLLFITVLSTVLFKKVYDYQTLPYFENIRKGCLSDLLLYGIPFSFLFSLFDSLVHYLLDDFFQKQYITNQKYIEPESRKKRCFTLVKWAYSMIYYFISSIAGYYILYDTSFFPSWLGGHGDPSNLMSKIPYLQQATLSLKVFYIIQFGKHFSRFFGHLFIRSEGEFYQYLLHHGLSIFLIVFSYLMNMWLIGGFVLLIHDFSDFFLILGRSYKDYKRYNKNILKIIFLIAFPIWIICRIIIFSYCCVYTTFLTIYNQYDLFCTPELQIIKIPYLFMGIMMFCLEILHLFWTYFIIQSFLSVNSNLKKQHTYD